MGEETVFYRDGGVLVTNTRFVIGTEVFAMRGVISVEGVRMRADVTGPAALVVFGALLMLFTIGQTIGLVIGGAMAVVGLWLAIRKRGLFAVVVRTATGEVIAYESEGRDDITKVIAALNEAIMAQGENVNRSP